MCGIAGELGFDGRGADDAAVRRMLPCLESRGPDGAGFWSNGPVALGHRRLKIIDLSEAGAQPMTDEQLGLTLVFNGIIYNYRQLREELRGHGYTFFSTSDTEVIIKAYHRWGADCVSHFLGMFAFAIVEHATGTVMLARDRLGIKPMYLAETPGRLRFSSTLPALLAAGDVDTSLDRVALQHYMTFHSVVPAPRTIVAGVRKLPPATVRIITADGTSTERVYWEADFTRTRSMSREEWAHAVGQSLRTAVERRMVADVPVGVLLSGGLDSSFIVALLAEQGQRGLTTFSIGFEAAAGEEGDEFAYSDMIAKQFDTVHHQIRIGRDRFLPAVARTVAAMAEPMVSHDAVAFNLLSEDVSKHVKVVQSGQGADEILAGYSWYPPLADVPREQAVDAYAREFFDRPHSDLARQLSPEWLIDADVSREFVAASFGRPGATTAVDAALRLDSQVMLVDDPVKRVDNMTMAWGLEARVPFLDHELVELAAACPPELKLAQGGKGVLKDAARGVVPDEVIDRTKGYFPVPAIRHLEGPMLDTVRDALCAPAMRVHRDGGELVIDGAVPWVTGWGLVDLLLVAARDGEDVHFVLADAQDAPTLQAVPQSMVAVAASRTVELRAAGHRVPAERLVHTAALADLLAGDAAGLRVNGSLALGLVLRCTRLVGSSPLDDELAAVRARLDTAGSAGLPAARAAAAALAHRAAGALVAATGSAAVRTGSAAERTAREAAFLLVFGSRPAIRSALLERLGAGGA